MDPCADIFHKPTTRKELADLEFEGVEKRDYKEKFERQEFTGTYHVPKKKQFNKQVYDRETQKSVYPSDKREKGPMKESFFSENDLGFV